MTAIETYGAKICAALLIVGVLLIVFAKPRKGGE